MDGTRENILREIWDWIADSNVPENILWLKGYPGIGKSTVASSLVERLRREKRLESYLFFQREKAKIQTPNALWRLVAFEFRSSTPRPGST
jgi:predicted ATPase